MFTLVTDPVADGFVASLARPGGNVTGFTIFEHTFAGKWLEMLKEGELPVQASSKFEMVINLKTAKALGITVTRRMSVHGTSRHLAAL